MRDSSQAGLLIYRAKGVYVVDTPQVKGAQIDLQSCRWKKPGNATQLTGEELRTQGPTRTTPIFIKNAGTPQIKSGGTRILNLEFEIR